MYKVALTGNVASGKSSVARVWAGAGVPVIRADDLAREVVAPGSDGLRSVALAFGEEFIQADGSLNRAKLRDLVFRDPGELARLEGILHPLIGSLRDQIMARHQAKGTPLVVAEIPLLYEVGLEGDFDAVVLVQTEEAEQLRRLREERGIPEERARQMMDAQIPAGEKTPKADFVLDNTGGLEDLEIRALALLDLIRARLRSREDQ